MQNGLNYRFVANGGIEHGVVHRAVGPFDVKVLLNEIGALSIHRVHKLLGFLVTLAAVDQAPHLVLPASIKKDPKGVSVVSEKMLGSSADNDAISFFGGMLDDALGNPQDALAIDELELVGVDASLVTSAQEGFEEAVVQRIGVFFTALDNRLGTIGQASDLFGELLVPQPPAKTLGEALSDFAAARSVFSLDGDYVDHGPSPALAAARCRSRYFTALSPPRGRPRRRAHSSSR
jgi:hypothetical protein